MSELNEPSPMCPTEFLEAGQGVLEAISEHWGSKLDRPVAPKIAREDLFEKFAGTIPEIGGGVELAKQLVQEILPNTMAMNHPLYLGLVNSSPLPSAVLADLVVSAIDNNGGASHQGPAQAAAEQEVVRWLSDHLNYSPYGMILPGGTFATLQGLQLAKQKHFPRWSIDGPGCLDSKPIMYCSDSVHFSASRAAVMMGLGESNIRQVPTTGRGQMDAGSLAQLIREDLAAGHQPFAVVASIGTTGTGAIDPIEEIADACDHNNLWLHIDACYGGAVAISEKHRHLTAHAHHADSIAIDLHKWFFMPLTAGICLTKHQNIAEDLYKVAASYIPGDDFVEAYERGMPTSRRSTGLAFWIAMKISGWKLIAETIDRNINSTRFLEQELSKHGFRVMPGGQLSVGCVRWEPETVAPSDWNSLQQRISENICRSGVAWFSTTVYQGETWIRFNPVNLYTTDAHIKELVPAFCKAAITEAEGSVVGS